MKGKTRVDPEIYDRLSALADATRVRLLRLLDAEELTVGELTRALAVPQPTVSRHLKQLLAVGFVERRAVGPASLFRRAALSAETKALWTLVKERVDADHAEDDARLAAVLAGRKVDSRTFFERVGGGWDALRRQLFGAGPTLAALLTLVPRDLVVADLGCGTGEVLLALAPHLDRVIGVDRETSMLEAARLRLGDRPHVSLRLGALDDLPLESASVDVALCMFVLHHIEVLAPVFVEAARALRPGGRLVVLDLDAHDRSEYRDTMGHAHLGFTARDLDLLAREAELQAVLQRVLEPEPEALGPPLRLAVFRRSSGGGFSSAPA